MPAGSSNGYQCSVCGGQSSAEGPCYCKRDGRKCQERERQSPTTTVKKKKKKKKKKEEKEETSVGISTIEVEEKRRYSLFERAINLGLEEQGIENCKVSVERDDDKITLTFTKQ